MRQAKVNSRKFIAVFTAVCMLLTFMPMSVEAAETEVTETAVNSPAFQDVTGHWGQTAIEKWSGYEIVNGYNGMFRPDDSITRGEMAVILDNLMDYQVAAENKFSDLKAGQFYTEAILKANAAGIIKGDGATVRPLDKITREESAVMMSRAFAVAESGSAMSFGDASVVSAWAKGAVAGMEAKGYVSGYAGKFDPKANITRAAAVTMINNIVKAYYTEAGTYTDNVDGTAIIKVSDVILKGVTISGNLIIAEGVGKGDATLDNVTVKGETVVRGGGENSVHIIGSSSIASIRIEKNGDKLRIVVADGANVKEVEVAVGEEIVITGTVGTLEVNAADAVVYATAAEITTATVNGDNSTIVVGAQSTINSLVVSSTADNTAIKAEAGSVVKTVEASATVAVTGTGTVSTVTLKAGADGSSVTTPKSTLNVGDGVTGTTGTGGTAIPAGSSGTNGTSATAPATVGSSTSTGSSGGGGGGTPTVAVSNITVTGTGSATTIAIDNGTLQMLADVQPLNATNKNVTWSVTNGTGEATISAEGLLTAEVNGTVIVKATSESTGSVSGTLEVTISNQKRANVATLDELKTALTDTNITIINIKSDISDIGERLLVDRAVTINGGNFKLYFTDAINGLAYGSRHGILISADDVAINDIMLQMTKEDGWQGTYGIQVYDAKGIVINNYTGIGADAGLLVNASEVELRGVITVTGNEFGGIEVSRGVADGLTNSNLLVTGTLINASETVGKPTVWLVYNKDQGKTPQGTIVGNGVPVKYIFKVKENGDYEKQYYLGNAPINLENVLPFEENVELISGKSFKLIVDASGDNIKELEVDHNINTLPEFSVYANSMNPYGSNEAAASFEELGVRVTYDVAESKWEIDFEPTVTNHFIENKGVIFYIVVKDEMGNHYGSMYEVNSDNSFSYNFSRVLPDAYIIKSGDLIKNDGEYITSFLWESVKGIGTGYVETSGRYAYFSDGSFLRFQVKHDDQIKSFDDVFSNMTLQTDPTDPLAPIDSIKGTTIGGRQDKDWTGNNGTTLSLVGQNYVFYGVRQNSALGTRTVGFDAGDSRTINMTLTPKSELSKGTYTVTIEVVQQGGNVLDDPISYSFVIN